MSVNASHYTDQSFRVRTRGINECKRFSLPIQSLGSEPDESMSVNVSHSPNPFLRVRTRGINECKRFSLPMTNP